MGNKDGVHNKVTVQGHKNGVAETVDVVNDGTYDRLAVDASITGVVTGELSELNDEVAVYGGVDGSETADAATRQILNVDSAGRVRTDSTLQIADADVSTSNPVPVQGTAADGSPVSGSPVLIGGLDGTNVQTIRTDGSGFLQAIGNIAHDAADSGNPVKIGGRANAAAPTAAAENDRVNTWHDLNGRVAVWDGATTLSVDDGAGTLTVDNTTLAVVGGGTEATAMRVTIANDSTGVVSVDDNGSTISIDDGAGTITVDNTTLAVVGGGTEATAMRVTVANDSTGVLSVDDNGGTLTVDNAALSVVGGGTEATAQRVTIANDSTGVVSVDDNGSSLTVDQATASSLNAQVVGNVAHDAADSGNPIKVGGRAVAHGATPTEVAAADRTDFLTNRQGVQFVMGGVPNVQTSQYLSTGTITDDNLLPAISAGTKYVVTRISVTLDEAVTVGVGFRLGFGATVVPAAPATNADAVAGILLTHPGLVPGGGITVGDGSGILGVGGDGEELRVTVSEAPTGGAIHFTVTWYATAS